MVWHHISQGARHIKITAAFFHAHSFRHCDLNMVNVSPVPYRLKDAIAEAKNENVLDRFFSQIMVNTENLALRQHLAYLTIECLRCLPIVAERLLTNHAPPMPILRTGQIGRAQMIHNVSKKSGAGSEIKEV